jgi:hypothetical protein
MECWEGGRIERVLPVSCGLVCSVCVSVSTITMLTLWWLLTLMQMNPTTAGKLSFILLFLPIIPFRREMQKIYCVSLPTFFPISRARRQALFASSICIMFW